MYGFKNNTIFDTEQLVKAIQFKKILLADSTILKSMYTWNYSG